MERLHFKHTYNSGAAVTLTAPTTSGSNTFSSWSGCTTASTVTCHVTLGGNTTVTANYATPTYTLTIDSANPASGVAITVTPADNSSATNGNTSFTRTYNSGTAVTLTAPTTSGSNTFSSWSGCTSSTPITLAQPSRSPRPPHPAVTPSLHGPVAQRQAPSPAM